MLENLFYIACFNAFLMKLISVDGLIHKPSKWLRDNLLSASFVEVPKLIQKVFKCVPCKFFWISVIEMYILFCITWTFSWHYFVYPFAIACMSVILYRFLNPNHEES